MTVFNCCPSQFFFVGGLVVNQMRKSTRRERTLSKMQDSCIGNDGGGHQMWFLARVTDCTEVEVSSLSNRFWQNFTGRLVSRSCRSADNAKQLKAIGMCLRRGRIRLIAS